ncbi:MAG: hypothetical protein AAF208_13550 [Cyanobacteria bacterium P01_A01_bin.45]
MSEFIVIGNFTIRKSEILLVGYRSYPINTKSKFYNCFVDVLIVGGAKVIVDFGVKRKPPFAEIQKSINSELGVKHAESLELTLNSLNFIRDNSHLNGGK